MLRNNIWGERDKEKLVKKKLKPRQKSYFRGPCLSYGEQKIALLPQRKAKVFCSGMELLRCSFIWPGKVKVRE